MLTISRTIKSHRAQTARKTGGDEAADMVRNVRLTEKALDPQQSLETVQTLLLVCFATICHLRCLLPDEAFEDRDFKSIRKDVHWSYDDLLHNRLPSIGKVTKPTESSRSNPSSPKEQRLFKIIGRQKSSMTDKLYLWLEGISHAISRRYLDSVRLSIILDKRQPNHVIESYNFAFTYESENLACASSSPETMVALVREDLFRLVRDLGSFCQTLPRLPAKRYLTTHLLYTPSCPSNYRPPGFQLGSEQDIFVPQSEEWRMRASGIGVVAFGLLNVNLDVDYPSSFEGDEHPLPPDFKRYRLLDRRTLAPMTASIASVEEQDIPTTRSMSTHSRASSRHIDRSSSRSECQTAAADIPQSQISPSPGGHSGLVFKYHLRSLLRSPSVANDLTQTQLDTLTAGRDKRDLWVLTTSKSHDLWTKRDDYIRTAALAERLWKCQCECGFGQKEGEMIQCDCCDTWQHRHCYAVDQKHVSDTHVCYKCLLEDRELFLLESLKTIARMRRVCWTLHNRLMPMSVSDLAKALGYSITESNRLLRNLLKQAIVTLSQDQESQKQTILLNKAEIRRNIEHHGVLHPLASIQHHYAQATPPSPLAASTQSIHSASLAPSSGGDHGAASEVAIDKRVAQASSPMSLGLGGTLLRNSIRKGGERASVWGDSATRIAIKRKKNSDDWEHKGKKRNRSSNAQSPISVSSRQ